MLDDEAITAALELRLGWPRFCSRVIAQGEPPPPVPFVGYLMLLADCAGAHAAPPASSMHALPEFVESSYAQRDRERCARLVLERLYSGAALLLSPAEEGAATGALSSLSDDTYARALFAGFAAHPAAFGLAHRR